MNKREANPVGVKLSDALAGMTHETVELNPCQKWTTRRLAGMTEVLAAGVMGRTICRSAVNQSHGVIE